jgi:hypothetical protein
VIKEAKLVAIRRDYYTVYVFKLVEDGTYLMCTRLPNWNVPEIKVGDVGFLNYNVVKAGDSYYNPNTDSTETYKYSNLYFINFINKTDITNDIIL